MGYKVIDITTTPTKKLKQMFLNNNNFCLFKFIAKKGADNREDIDVLSKHGVNAVYMIVSDDFLTMTPSSLKVSPPRWGTVYSIGDVHVDTKAERKDDFGKSMICVIVEPNGNMYSFSRYDIHVNPESYYVKFKDVFDWKELTAILGTDAKQALPPRKIVKNSADAHYGNYHIEYMDKFSTCRKYAKVNGYTSLWNFVKDADAYEAFTRNGLYSLYILTSPVYDTVTSDFIYGNGYRAYNYGTDIESEFALSMVAVLLDENGKFITALNRYAAIEDAKYISSQSGVLNQKQIKRILGAPYSQSLLNMSKKEMVLDTVKNELRKNTPITSIFRMDKNDLNLPIIPVGFKELTTGKNVEFTYGYNWLIASERKLLFPDIIFENCRNFIPVNTPSGQIKNLAVFRKKKYNYVTTDKGEILPVKIENIRDFTKLGYALVYDSENRINFIDSDGIFISDNWFVHDYNTIHYSFNTGNYAIVKYRNDANTVKYECIFNILDSEGNLLLPDDTSLQIIPANNGNCLHLWLLKRPAGSIWQQHKEKYEYNVFNTNTGKFYDDFWFSMKNWDMNIMNRENGRYAPVKYHDPVTGKAVECLLDHDGVKYNPKTLQPI